jgi:two-component system cell cycle response regulator
MGARILVIEDNEANLDLMTYLLNAYGHATITARDGPHGLVQAKAGAIDLIICDIQLPKMDGYEIARLIKADAEIPAVPLIAVTALAMVGDQDKILSAGFDGYIAKPIAPDEFVGQIEAFLAHHLRSTLVLAGEPISPARVVRPKAIGSAHILLVDDTADNLGFMRSLLEPFGYRISEAPSGTAAVALALADAPDLIVADLHMPAGNGLDLLSAIQSDARLMSIPCVMISASVPTDLEHATALARGARTFILRPIEPLALLAEIEACLQPPTDH